MRDGEVASGAAATVTGAARLHMHDDGEVASEGTIVQNRDACKPSSRTANTRMREPDEMTVIRFSTNRRGGYTYVAFRIPRSQPGEASWYPTGIQQFMGCHAEDISGGLEQRFPFHGIVTWEQIVEFAADNPIYIATQWKTHPDWP